MIRMRRRSEVVGGLRKRAGDDVPCNAATAHMVERSEIARKIVGLGVSRNGCGRQSDAARDGSQCGEQRERFETNNIRRVLGRRRTQRIGEEEHVELAALCRLRDLAKKLKVESSRLGLRHSPSRYVVPR